MSESEETSTVVDGVVGWVDVEVIIRDDDGVEILSETVKKVDGLTLQIPLEERLSTAEVEIELTQISYTDLDQEEDDE